ncbi:hypothetical protein HCC18_02795 [Listeria booriae]|uniref:hypothetical protein n=1 Tax=Listeria booriae TaxID=1552123 RepID=UPI00162ACF0D|nr:hypothetical protein [Listeria booriae]MBC2315758.1 hypothetical protein [Listeria booriae]
MDESIGKQYKTDTLSNIITNLMHVIKEESPELSDKSIKREARRRFIDRVDSSFYCTKNKAVEMELHHFGFMNYFKLKANYNRCSLILAKSKHKKARNACHSAKFVLL